jgi:RNA-directed DNA polymerase
MSEPKTSIDMSTALTKVADRARKDPQGRMRLLAHHIDVEALRRCFERLRNDAAKGLDRVSEEQYAQNLE